MSLWKSSDPKQYEEFLDQYWTLVESIGKDRLLELERWYQEELPKSLQSKDSLDKTQLVKLVDWKLTRGKWRPRLLDYAKDASTEQVSEASLKSFASLPNTPEKDVSEMQLKESLNHLIELKGVGPATATAILSAKHPSIAFMSDEALLAVFSKKEYTLKYALMLTAELQKKAKELSKAGTRQWTARMVEQCLFIEKRAGGSSDDGAVVSKGKRSAKDSGGGGGDSSGAKKRTKKK